MIRILMIVVFLVAGVVLGGNTARAEQITKIGTCYNLWSQLNDLATDGRYAYIAGGATGLIVLDLEDPEQPTEIGHLHPSDIAAGVWYPRKISLIDTTALLLSDYGLTIVNVSDRSAPFEISYVNISRATDLEVSDDFAYLSAGGDGSGGFVIVDISDKVNPVVRSSTRLPEYGNNVGIIGDYAFVRVEFYGTIIFDISNPDAPDSVGIINLREVRWSPGEFVVAGDLIYDIGYGGFNIVNVADPLNPALLGSIELDGWGCPVLSEGTIFIARGDSGFEAIDVSDAENPRIQGSLDGLGWVTRIGVNGTLGCAISTSNGLSIIDVADPAAPSLTAAYDGDRGLLQSAVISGDYAYLADSLRGLRIADISDSTNPVEVTLFENAGCIHSLAVQNDTVYAIGSDVGLKIIDCTNPVEPVGLGAFDTPGRAYGIALGDGFAFISDGDSGLTVLDVSDPTQPAVRGSLNLEGRATSITVEGQYAYLSTVQQYVVKLWVVDISDPASPELRGSFQNVTGYVTSRSGLALFDHYVLWAAGELLVVDVADPENPRRVFTDRFNREMVNVYVEGSAAFATSSRGYLYTYDLTIPDHLRENGRIRLPGISYGLAARGNIAFVAEGLFFDIYDCTDALGATQKGISNLPTLLSLSAFPNPFNSSTTISYSLPLPGRYVIDVIDLQGRLVTRLSDGWKEAGSYREVFGSMNIPSGTLLLKLTNSNENNYFIIHNLK